MCRNAEASLLASGDDFGKVKLFLYPATQPKVSLTFFSTFRRCYATAADFVSLSLFIPLQSLSHTYGGHSSHVTAVKFMHDDTRLISTGGNDTSVMQWIVS